MQNKIRGAFPVCDERSCLTSFNDKEVHFHDPENSKCIILSENDDIENLSNFKALNPNQKEIYFLCIDHCIYIASDPHKKCDFALFDNSLFCFVEIKDTLNTRQRGKASSQLKSTIEKFREVIDFTGYEIEAIISLKYRPMVPAARSTLQAAIFDFEDNLGVRLLEGNEKEFR